MSAPTQPSRMAWTTRQRTLITAAVLLPVIFVLLLAGHAQREHGLMKESPCWILPNGWAVRPPGSSDCPLDTLDRVQAVVAADGTRTAVAEPAATKHALVKAGAGARLEIQRSDQLRNVAMPLAAIATESAVGLWAAALLAAAGLLFIPLLVLWRSEAPAALPMALIQSALAVVTVCLIAGRDSAWCALSTVVALALVPGGLAHLSFNFPSPRRVVRDVPGIVWVPYGVSAFVAVVGIAGLTVSPVLFQTYFWLLVASMLGAWAVLLLSCAFAVRDSGSSVERARGQLVAYGALLVPILPLAVTLQYAPTIADILSTYLYVSFLALSLPIGLAISRYNLFDIGWDARHWIARLIYFGLGALLAGSLLFVALGYSAPQHPLRALGILFTLSLACLVVVEMVRRPLLGFLESMLTPRLEQLSHLRERYAAEIAQLRDEDTVVELLASVLREGIAPRCGSVFLRDGEEWRAAHVFGENPPTRAAVLPDALQALQRQRFSHLALDSEAGSAPARRLESEGIELAASLDCAGTRYGVVLLGPPERGIAYNGTELDFVSATAVQAGTALHNARLARQLIAAERDTTNARVAVSLMHDVGKDLGWIRQLARRLSRPDEKFSVVPEEVQQIQTLTASVIARMREFMRDATQPAASPPGVSRLDEVLESCLRNVSERHGATRVRQNIDPQLRNLRCHENVGRAVAHLVENGLQASAPDGPVHISANLADPETIELVVTDSGPGIAPEVLKAAFDPGFTTRSHQGGNGVGLAVSRDMVEALDGEIELTPAPAGGTRATVRVPTLLIPEAPKSNLQEAEHATA